MKRKPPRADGKPLWDVEPEWSTKFGAWVRPGSSDENVWSEIRAYAPMTLTPKDIVLDIGANIGAYTRYALSKSVRLVVAFEPDEDNFKVLTKNLSLNGKDLKAILVNAALISSDQPYTTLYVNKGTMAGSHSTTPFRGRDAKRVRADQFSNVLHRYKPTKIKSDCEGSEYDLFLNTKLPKSVKEVILEVHLRGRGWRAQMPLLHAAFLKQGFKCLIAPKDNGTSWHTGAHYQR